MFFVSETSSGHHWKCRGMDGKLKSKERKVNEKNGESNKTNSSITDIHTFI